MPMDEHYFTADPSVAFKRIPVRAQVWGLDLELTTGSGVFAQGRVDIGTSVLFRETEPPGSGEILDLGCGYGLIGLAVAAAVPEAGDRRGRQRARSAPGQRERRCPRR